MKKSPFSLRTFAAVLAAVSAANAYGQNAIQLFSQPANIRASTQGTSYSNPNGFNSTIVDLTCTAPIQAVLSSSASGSGNVLVDNFITFNTTGGNPVDICSKGTVDNGTQQNCFNSNYGSAAKNGGLDGQDTDLYVATGGVQAIDVSNRLTAGHVQATIGLVDTGGELASSTLYLVTNCTFNGVAGPGQVTGNPISKPNPTPPQLAQTFVFNGNAAQQVQFNYDLSQAQNAGSLTIPNGSAPSTGTTPLDPTTFQADFLRNTSFATANCLLHTGQLINNAPACELVTLTCQIGTNPAQAGALCPASQQFNELVQEQFDGPTFSLPDISGGNGLTYHTGVGFLEAKDDWPGGPCAFDPASSLAGATCPQNVLSSFSGPGAYSSGGRLQSPNSSFINVAPVPMDLTTVKVDGQHAGHWINKTTLTAHFVSTPPVIPGNNYFVAAPIGSLTYGISDAWHVPSSDNPVPGDITLTDAQCPAPPPAAVFTPSPQPISVGADGRYLLHYTAQDCAGTRELKFTNTNGNWTTSFYTFPVNVDTVPPVVAWGPTLSPVQTTSYTVGQTVYASYRCTDDRSGIVQCGASSYSPGATKDTGVITSPVDTWKTGKHTYTVQAVDAAGNTTSASVDYQVIEAVPVNLFILKLAPLFAQQDTQLTYAISVTNFCKNDASSVAITDTLPAGVSFVKAGIAQAGCGSKCSTAPSCTVSGSTVTCTAQKVASYTPLLAEITVQVTASPGSKIKNTATVTSANPEGYPSNTQSTAVTVVTK